LKTKSARKAGEDETGAFIHRTKTEEKKKKEKAEIEGPTKSNEHVMALAKNRKKERRKTARN